MRPEHAQAVTNEKGSAMTDPQNLRDPQSPAASKITCAAIQYDMQVGIDNEKATSKRRCVTSTPRPRMAHD